LRFQGALKKSFLTAEHAKSVQSTQSKIVTFHVSAIFTEILGDLCACLPSVRVKGFRLFQHPQTIKPVTNKL